MIAFTALTLLVGRQEGHPRPCNVPWHVSARYKLSFYYYPACKKTEWWGAGVVICLERGADLHMAQLVPLPLTVSCWSKIQIGSTFLVPAHLGSPGQRAVKRVCVSYDNARVTIDLRRTSNLRNISRRADGSRLQFTCKIVRYSVNRAPDVTAVSQPQFFTVTPAVRENHHLGPPLSCV